jgi:hypothetical protein
MPLSTQQNKNNKIENARDRGLISILVVVIGMGKKTKKKKTSRCLYSLLA